MTANLSITGHTHLDGARHEGALSECNYDAIAKSNREWAATYGVKCVECGHVASESMADPVEGCECCRQARTAEPAPCRACAADRADIGAFPRGIPHTSGPDCTAPAWIVRAQDTAR